MEPTVTTAVGSTTHPLFEIARAWASIENDETEIDPRELARWFASWRNDLDAGTTKEGDPLSLLMSEAMTIDGHGHPADFVDWFIDWRRRVLTELVASGRGCEIAGLPLSAGMSTLVFQFEEDLEEGLLRDVEEALEALENGGYVAVVAAAAATVFDRLLEAVERVRPASDLVGKVYRAMAIDAARARRSEYGRYAAP